MLSTLNDPYSVYMDKQTAKQFSDSLDSSFEGIGAEVGMKDNKIIIVSPFKQSVYTDDFIIRLEARFFRRRLLKR